jgi:GTPase SAR1 family protein
MKYIVQPLNRRKRKDMEPIGNMIAQQWGIWLLYGNAKVGKTSLVYKIHRWMYKNGFENPVVHVPMSILQEHHIEHLLSKLNKCKWVKGIPYYIFLDDIEYLKSDSLKQATVNLIEKIMSLSSEYKVLLFLSSNTKTTLKEYIEPLKLEENGMTDRYLRLQRPAYIGGVIKYFGDCILTVEN